MTASAARTVALDSDACWPFTARPASRPTSWYWFWGRLLFYDLRPDLRSATSEIRHVGDSSGCVEPVHVAEVVVTADGRQCGRGRRAVQGLTVMVTQASASQVRWQACQRYSDAVLAALGFGDNIAAFRCFGPHPVRDDPGPAAEPAPAWTQRRTAGGLVP